MSIAERREDWKAGAIRSRGPSTPLAYFLFGAPVTLVGIGYVVRHGPARLVVPVSSASDVALLLLFLLVFLLLGPLPFFVGGARLLRLLRWGRSVVCLSPRAGQIGGSLSGSLRLPEQGPRTYTLTLSCRTVHARRLLSQGNLLGRGYFDRVHFQQMLVLEQPSGATDLPFSFALPANLPPTDQSDDEPTSGVFWKLRAHAARPLLSYLADFTVPVDAADASGIDSHVPSTVGVVGVLDD